MPTAQRVEIGHPRSGAIPDTGDFVLPVSMLADGTALFRTKERTVYAIAVPEKQGVTG